MKHVRVYIIITIIDA